MFYYHCKDIGGETMSYITSVNVHLSNKFIKVPVSIA